ncbi:MAG: MurR/RpiR family transcriptional regulator [Rhodoferax sp.]|nr:MurR/RpiR family transcriptional regulator [Rhodoferax sp.]
MTLPTTPNHAASTHVDAGFAASPLGQQLRAILTQGKGSNVVIADFLLRNPVRATAWGIEELASQTRISTATLSRFARQLGYAGFAALRAAMADALQTAIQPVYQPVEKLRGALERKSAHQGTSVLVESQQVCLANVTQTVAGMDAARINAVAKRVRDADTVYTLGFGISAHLAAMLALDLQPFCRQSINVVEFGGTEVAAGRLMNIGPKDLLIAISFPRYASDAVTLTRYARDRGARIVALTDSPASPLAAWAHDMLLCAASHPVLSSSYAAAVVMAETLVTSLMLSGGNHIQQAEKLTEAIAAYMYSDKPGNETPTGRKARKISRGS